VAGDLDPEFLAELPEDVRREVVEDHRRRRMARGSGVGSGAGTGLGYHAPGRRPDSGSGADGGGGSGAAPRGQTRLKFPAKPPRVAFARSGLTSVKEVKEMVGVWHEATREEGPHRADVEVFERYVARVVGEERDMEKARVLVKWLGWLVEEGGEGVGKESWREAVVAVKGAVQGAMRERGLGVMDFG
jgi:DNA repair protein REV1